MASEIDYRGKGMSYRLKYFIDKLDASASLRPALSRGHRMIYVQKGSGDMSGKPLSAGQGGYFATDLTVTAGPEGVTLFRWDLTKQSADGALLEGNGVQSTLRMDREIWSLDLRADSQWLFRLDKINIPAGTVADLHTHPGPGIRALLSGTFSVRQASEDGKALAAGDPWWETGIEAVIATADKTQTSTFMRCMVLPAQYVGASDTAHWLRARIHIDSSWKVWTLLADEIVTV
jgi:hypothetical protein